MLTADLVGPREFYLRYVYVPDVIFFQFNFHETGRLPYSSDVISGYHPKNTSVINGTVKPIISSQNGHASNIHVSVGVDLRSLQELGYIFTAAEPRIILQTFLID